MVLNNVRIVNRSGRTNIHIVRDHIAFITSSPVNKTLDFNQLTFSNALVFPGLINSHDHLDFNLFPQLGNRIYTNYTEWGKDIHAQHKELINRILSIPRQLRILWGIYKNLLNGITTVVNHGPPLKIHHDLISVFQDCYSLHSTGFEKNWRWKLNRPARHRPFVIHTGEGTDEHARKEIDDLIRWNLFKRDIIGVHGVAISEKQAEALKALVWCPASNYFLLNRTASVKKLKKKTRIIFGTDSTLTACWNLWEHLRLARTTGLANDAELFNMLTISPAEVWGLRKCGKISEHCEASLVVAANNSQQSRATMNAFYATNPEDILLVMHKGNIRLFDAGLLEQLSNSGFDLTNFSKIQVNGIEKYVEGNLPGLIKEIRKYCPGAHLPVNLI